MSGADAGDEALWAAVADPSRRGVLDLLLAGGEGTPTSLARALPFTRQAVAKHLAVLERAGLVEGHRQGREVRYTVRAERVDEAMRAIERVAARWDERLDELKRAAEAEQGAASPRSRSA